MSDGQLALVTGGSSGIGRALAARAALDGYALLIAADTAIEDRAGLEATGVAVDLLETDLSGPDGVQAVIARLDGRVPDLFFANAGQSLGHSFVSQDIARIGQVMGTNVVQTTLLAHHVIGGMVARGRGRVLFTGSIAGMMPGTYQAVYNATKAYVNSLSVALGHELMGTGVTVTCLMPGATETHVFARAGMEDTPVGRQRKDDPAMVAEAGYRAMMAGRDRVISGWKSRIEAAGAQLLPPGVVAELHRWMARPAGRG